MDALRIDPPKRPGIGGNTTDRKPLRDAVFPAADALTRDPGVDVREIDADVDEPLGEEIRGLAVTDVVPGEQPEVADVQLPRIADA